MDLSKIKKLVKQNGDKFIFVDNGEPEMVVMSFHEYEKLNGLSQQKYSADLGLSGGGPTELARPSFIKQNLDGLVDFGLEEVQETEFVTSQGAGTTGLSLRPEDVRLEDLPI